MPACNIVREVSGTTAWYRAKGRFESSCAWDLSRRIAQDPMRELALDFSQVSDFVDYGIAVLASALLEVRQKKVRLLGLRQHQLRLFKYFGVEPEELAHAGDAAAEMRSVTLLAHGLA
jgi:anti-anti-sigma regulatory factor